MRGEEHLERGGVQGVQRAGHVGQRLVGDQHERIGSIAEEQVEVHEDDLAGMALGETDGQIGGDNGLARSSLRGEHGDEPALGSLGRLDPGEVGPQTGAGLQRPVECLEQLLGNRIGCDHVAGACPQGVLPHLGAGRRHDEDGDLGAETLQLACHVEGDFEREVGTERDDFGISGGDLLDRRHWILEPHLAEPATQVAVQPSLKGAPDVGLELTALGGDGDAAHGCT